MRELKILFLPYLGLGLFTGVMVRAGWHIDLKGDAIVAAFYAGFIGFAVLLATLSKTEKGRAFLGASYCFSPGGWYVGLGLAHVTGILIGCFA